MTRTYELSEHSYTDALRRLNADPALREFAPALMEHDWEPSMRPAWYTWLCTAPATEILAKLPDLHITA